MASVEKNPLLAMTRDIVVAEITHNAVPPEALPALIHEVYESLRTLSEGALPEEPPVPAQAAGHRYPRFWRASRGVAARPALAGPDALAVPAPTVAESPAGPEATFSRTAREEGVEPAVPREASVRPDRIVCLFDGVERKMLKRHLATRYGMTPEHYRQYWELPEDYPMTAPAYAEEKRDYALRTGFGRASGRRRRGR